MTYDYAKADEKASDYMNKGQYSEALKVYLKSSGVSNNSAVRDMLIAKCYVNLNDSANALKYYLKAYAQDSMDVRTVIFAATIGAEYLKTLTPRTEYYYRRALRLYPDNLFLLERSSDYYMSTKQFKECVEVGLLAEKKYPTDRTILRNTGAAALMTKNYNLAVAKHETLNMMYPSDTNLTHLALAYLVCSNNNIKSPEFQKGAKLINNAYKLNPKNAMIADVYEKYKIAAIVGLHEPQSFTPKEMQKQNAASRYKNSFKPPVVLYAGKSETVTSNGMSNTIIKRFGNGSENGLTHNKEGSTSRPTHYSKGQGPPKDTVLPTGREMFDLVLNNKKLTGYAKLDFLIIELEYYKKPRRLLPTEEAEIKKLVKQIETWIDRLKKNKK